MEEKLYKLNEILSYLPNEEKEKIPECIYEYINNNMKKVNFTFDTSKEFEKQDVEDCITIAFAYISKYYSNIPIEKIDLELYEKDYSLLNKIIEIEKENKLFDLLEYNKFIKNINSRELKFKQIHIEFKNINELNSTEDKIERNVEESKVFTEYSLVEYKKSFISNMISKLKKLIFFRKSGQTNFDKD